MESSALRVSVGQILPFADEETEVHKEEVSSPPRSNRLVLGLLTVPVPWWSKKFLIVVQSWLLEPHCLFSNNGSSPCQLGDFRIPWYYLLHGVVRIKWDSWYEALHMVPGERSAGEILAVILSSVLLPPSSILSWIFPPPIVRSLVSSVIKHPWIGSKMKAPILLCI